MLGKNNLYRLPGHRLALPIDHQHLGPALLPGLADIFRRPQPHVDQPLMDHRLGLIGVHCGRQAHRPTEGTPGEFGAHIIAFLFLGLVARLAFYHYAVIGD